MYRQKSLCNDRETRKVFRFYTAAMIKKVEKWLAHMSKEGYQLVAVHGWMFTFKEAPPRERCYCLYVSFDRSEGLWDDFFCAKRDFAHKGSLAKNNNVFEVDLKKAKNGFDRFIKARDRFYFRHYIHLLVFSSILILFAVMIKRFILAGLLFGLWVYALLSAVFVKKSKGR